MAPFRYWEPYNRRPARRRRGVVASRRLALAPYMEAPNTTLLRALKEFVRVSDVLPDRSVSNLVTLAGTRSRIH